MIATATPVNELSSEITTGMSAPPIGSTKSTPSSSAAASSDDEAPQRQHAERYDEPAGEPDDRQQHNAVDELLSRIGDRAAGHEFLQLQETR